MDRHYYQLVVTGRLGAAASEAFADLDIEFQGDVTVIAGELDQAALFGTIHRIQHFALELIEITRVHEHAAN